MAKALLIFQTAPAPLYEQLAKWFPRELYKGHPRIPLQQLSSDPFTSKGGDVWEFYFLVPDFW